MTFHHFIAIDPGPTQSAYLRMNEDGIHGHGISGNATLLSYIEHQQLPVVIEGIESFGMAVGKDVFETVFLSGRFAEAAPDFVRIYRKQVKMHLCKSMRAKDANIRQALIDRYGPGKDAAIGKKATPGPLYGVKSHIWSALAVAVTYIDTQAIREAA